MAVLLVVGQVEYVADAAISRTGLLLYQTISAVMMAPNDQAKTLRLMIADVLIH